VSIRYAESLSGAAGAVSLYFTDRLGGASRPPYDGANLGDHVGDDPAAVAANRVELANAVGLAPDRLVFSRQVHGADVVEVTAPWTDTPPEADGLVTTAVGLALVVLVADCIPILFSDTEIGVVGVAHAGRRGMAAGVAVRVVEAMRDLGARSLIARVGPSVCARCYTVPAQMRDEVAASAPLAASVDRRGNPSIDIAAGVLDQLAPLCCDVELVPGCTHEDPTLYSYRRDQTTGRFAGVAVRDAERG
jgi:YfiH family protein